MSLVPVDAPVVGVAMVDVIVAISDPPNTLRLFVEACSESFPNLGGLFVRRSITLTKLSVSFSAGKICVHLLTSLSTSYSSSLGISPDQSSIGCCFNSAELIKIVCEVWLSLGLLRTTLTRLDQSKRGLLVVAGSARATELAPVLVRLVFDIWDGIGELVPVAVGVLVVWVIVCVVVIGAVVAVVIALAILVELLAEIASGKLMVVEPSWLEADWSLAIVLVVTIAGLGVDLLRLLWWSTWLSLFPAT